MRKSTGKSRAVNSKLKSVQREIVALCGDKAKAKHLLDEILSLQKQADIEPTEIHVAESEVVARYEFGAFSIIRCKTCFIFKTTGYRIVSKPIYTANEDGGVLYSHLDALCVLKEKELSNALDETEKIILENLVTVTIPILAAPLFIFGSDKDSVEVASLIIEKILKRGEERFNAPLKEETAEDEMKNDAFRMQVMLDEEQKKKKDNGNA